LGISSASTTKLLDRLERGGHIERRPHPHDRRALALSVTERTREAAEATIGHEHARRFRIAASLDEAEREIVARFLNALAHTGEDTWPTSPERVPGRSATGRCVRPPERPPAGSRCRFSRLRRRDSCAPSPRKGAPSPRSRPPSCRRGRHRAPLALAP